MYYNECPFCGANLDPGEPYDCQEEKKSKKKLSTDTGFLDDS